MTRPAPKRIAMVVTVESTARSFVRKFAAYVAGLGYDVVVIADGLSPSSQRLGKGSLSFEPLQMVRDPHPLKDASSLLAMIRRLRSLKPDVLVYATPKASLLSAVAGWFARVPIRVYQIWGLRLETTTGPARFILNLVERVTSLFSTKITANSHSLARRYESLGLNGARPITVVAKGSSHGVDLEYFSRPRRARLSTTPPEHSWPSGKDISSSDLLAASTLTRESTP